MNRMAVPKTYKLFIGGKFVRSESGRTYPVQPVGAAASVNVSQASRKDARDAVSAALGSGKAWSATTAYNRGQVLYRVAEVLEGRFAQFVTDVMHSEGISQADAEAQVEQSIDQWVWYAGWCDKFAQVTGNANPVAGPYFNISVPEPSGVVAVIAPQDSSLLGLVSSIAPPLVAGNTVVLLASERCPIPSITLSEVLATSDVPAGVVNILTGSCDDIAPWLVQHPDVNAVDLTGAADHDWVALEAMAANTLIRVRRPDRGPGATAPSLERIRAFTETKTIWHTKSLI